MVFLKNGKTTSTEKHEGFAND